MAEIYRTFLVANPSFLPKEGAILVEEGLFLPSEGLLLPDEPSLLTGDGTLLPKEGTIDPSERSMLADEGCVLSEEPAIACAKEMLGLKPPYSDSRSRSLHFDVPLLQSVLKCLAVGLGGMDQCGDETVPEAASVGGDLFRPLMGHQSSTEEDQLCSVHPILIAARLIRAIRSILRNREQETVSSRG
ncbi:hypothetical protein ACXR0O_23275 [Verrucomicrobiota bacterium sgz303538]